MPTMTWEQAQQALQAKMAEIRATKDFQERDWKQLQRDAIRLRENIRKLRK